MLGPTAVVEAERDGSAGGFGERDSEPRQLVVLGAQPEVQVLTVCAEARAREARERAAQERAAAPSLSTGIDDYSRLQPQIYRSSGDGPRINNEPIAATVRAFDVSFVRLVTFFLKAVVAAIPAILLLGVVLWVIGTGLEMVFPQLIKMKILIGFSS